MASRSWAARRPDLSTGVLAVLLMATGIGATLLTPAGAIVATRNPIPAAAMLAGLVPVFLVAEWGLVHAEMRRQTYSFSLSAVPLLVGLLLGDARAVVAARLLAALLAFLVRREPGIKVAYNLGSFALEAGATALGLHLLLGTADRPVSLAVAGGCLLVALTVDQITSALVLLVIFWHSGRPITGKQALSALGPAAALSAHCTVATVVVVALLNEGAFGVALIGVLITISGGLYRGYLVLRRRHASLAVMHEFVQQGTGTDDVRHVAEALLTRIRQMLNVAHVDLLAFRAEDDIHLHVDEDDQVTVTTSQPRTPRTDWLMTRVLENDEAILISRKTRERGLRQWLLAHEAREAIVLPLPGTENRGVLMVRDCLGETSVLTQDDRRLLQTLAGHLGVALQGSLLLGRLRHEATHDALTGLANRLLLAERLEQALTPPMGPAREAAAENAATDTTSPAVLMLDLDRFKEVNDAFGHHAGDDLLVVVGQRITATVPAAATVARLGGDEFAVLLPGMTEIEVRRLALDVHAALTRPIPLEQAVVNTGASIGIALARPDTSAADLLRYADTAMYSAKGGREAFVVYTPALDRGRTERLMLLADLHQALEDDQMEMLYQPQLDLRAGRIRSVEALVRWRHPSLGLLGPDRFIPLAESSGLIDQLTEQVLRKALLQCRSWHEAGVDLTVAVNISAHNVSNQNLPEEVAALLAETGVPAERLLLEITESSVMGDAERTLPVLERLSALGLTLSLDDFGTGYSSLAYLQRLPVSEVKIDKSFVTELGAPASDRASALVRSILSLAESLGLHVVAEGVEDAATLELLRGWGCDLIQGYHIARPLPATEVQRLVTSAPSSTSGTAGTPGRRPAAVGVPRRSEDDQPLAIALP